jgi:hypothetical protein
LARSEYPVLIVLEDVHNIGDKAWVVCIWVVIYGFLRDSHHSERVYLTLLRLLAGEHNIGERVECLEEVVGELNGLLMSNLHGVHIHNRQTASGGGHIQEWLSINYCEGLRTHSAGRSLSRLSLSENLELVETPIFLVEHNGFVGLGVHGPRERVQIFALNTVANEFLSPVIALRLLLEHLVGLSGRLGHHARLGQGVLGMIELASGSLEFALGPKFAVGMRFLGELIVIGLREVVGVDGFWIGGV